MKSLRLAAIAASLLLATQSYGDTTNVVQNLSVQFFGVTQGGTFTNRNLIVTSANNVRVDTRRVIAALGNATANTFSLASRLVVVTPLGGGSPTFQVRDGTKSVDVTSFFTYETLSGTVESSISGFSSGRSFETDYNLQRLALQDGSSPISLHFDVSGLATTTINGSRAVGDVTIDAAGAGSNNGNLILLQGGVSIHGQSLEVVPGGGGGDGGPGV